MIAFTGGFLLTVCLVHLLPEVYGAGLPDVAGFVLAGFIIQILLDQMSAGLEHGHVHIHNNSVWTPWIIITGLFLHALLEGIPLGGHSHESGHESHDLLLAIALHKLPEGIALGFLLIQLKKPIWLNITPKVISQNTNPGIETNTGILIKKSIRAYSIISISRMAG
jgi:zinc transporter ZupT